jgi:hypothetical protein
MSHDLVRLSRTTLEAFNAFILQQKITDLQMELMTLHDLVKQIDPDHMYVFSHEYQAFIKTPNPSKSESEKDEEEDFTSGIYKDGVVTRGVVPPGYDLLMREVGQEVEDA